MVPVEITDPVLLDHLASLGPDGITVFSLGGEDGPRGGDVRGALLHGTALVARARCQHGLGLVEALVLGQAYLAALLVASTLKGRDRTVIRLDCSGSVRGFSVEGMAVDGDPEAIGEPVAGKAEGRRRNAVRGYLFQDPIPMEAELESFDLAPLVGTGSLTVTRFIAGAPRPFTGAVSLRSGRLAEDLAAYYLESEQKRTAFKLSLVFDREGRVSGAGGLFLQALPGAREDFVSLAEAALLGLPSIGAWFAAGKTAEALLGSAFTGEGLRILATEGADFACSCSRGRFASFLSSANDELLRDLATEGPWPVETACHNCSSTYGFPRQELEAMAQARGIKLRQDG